MVGRERESPGATRTSTYARIVDGDGADEARHVDGAQHSRKPVVGRLHHVNRKPHANDRRDQWFAAAPTQQHASKAQRALEHAFKSVPYVFGGGGDEEHRAVVAVHVVQKHQVAVK